VKLTNSTEGHFNYNTKEFHKETPTDNCNFNQINDEVILSWKEAKDQGADPCGHCFPGKSKVNNGKTTIKATTGLF
jgi:hypothetical protein